MIKTFLQQIFVISICSIILYFCLDTMSGIEIPVNEIFCIYGVLFLSYQIAEIKNKKT